MHSPNQELGTQLHTRLLKKTTGPPFLPPRVPASRVAYVTALSGRTPRPQLWTPSGLAPSLWLVLLPREGSWGKHTAGRKWAF